MTREGPAGSGRAATGRGSLAWAVAAGPAVLSPLWSGVGSDEAYCSLNITVTWHFTSWAGGS
jgi:hypothetical protein